jgi:hypothetical protein
LTRFERSDCTENVVPLYVINLRGLIKQGSKGNEINASVKVYFIFKVNFTFFLPSFVFYFPISLLVSYGTVMPHERCNLPLARVIIAFLYNFIHVVGVRAASVKKDLFDAITHYMIIVKSVITLGYTLIMS